MTGGPYSGERLRTVDLETKYQTVPQILFAFICFYAHLKDASRVMQFAV